MIKLISTHDNESLFKKIKEVILETIQSEKFQILRDKVSILTRETVSSEYLSMQLVRDGIPALSFEATRLKDFLDSLILEFRQNLGWKVISNFQAENLIYLILKNKKDFYIQNEKGIRKIARDIYVEYEEQIARDSGLLKKYQEIISEFKKEKQDWLTPKETWKLLLKQDLSKSKILKQRAEVPLYLFGLSHIEVLPFEILKKISKIFPIFIYCCEPYFDFMSTSSAGNLSRDSLFLKDLPTEKEIRKSESILNKTKLFFYEVSEIHREVEFVARHILGKISESLSDDFHLTRIKVILPDSPSYAISLKNTFQKLNLPFAFTNEIYTKKQTAYYNAVLSLIQLVRSNFERQKALLLFQNPCFLPGIPSEENQNRIIRQVIQPELWVSILTQMNLSGYLDSAHRVEMGLSDEDFGTWDGFWKRALLAHQGETLEGALLSEEMKEEIPILVSVTYSLLQDLVFLKTESFSPREFAKFFITLLDFYLDPSFVPESEESKQRDYHKKLQEMIYNSIKLICADLDSLITGAETYTLDMYLDYIIEGLSKLSEGSGRILRHGVVVGSFVDTSDLIFDYIYVLGVDERKVPTQVIPKEYITSLENSKIVSKNLYLYSKECFYSVFNYSAKEIHFSYVNRDTIGDKPIYPSQELLVIQQFAIKNAQESTFTSIPLFTYLEPNIRAFQSLSLEREAIQTIWLKQLENEFGIDGIIPLWEDQQPNTLQKAQEAWQKIGLGNKLTQLHFIPKLKIPKPDLPDELPLRKFLQYLECPRKFFYTNFLRLEEEEIQEEYKNFDGLQRWNFLKSFCKLYFSSPTQDSFEMLKILKKETISHSQFPKGLLGEVEWKHLESDIQKLLQNLQFLNWENTQWEPRFRGSETWGEGVFPAGKLFGKIVSFRADMLFYSGSETSLVKFVFSKDIRWKPSLEVSLQLLSLQDSSSDFESWNSKILHLNPDLKVELKEIPKIQNSQSIDFLKKRWKQFAELPELTLEAEPMERPEGRLIGTCSYCQFRKICPGYLRAFENENQNKENSEWKESFLRI